MQISHIYNSRLSDNFTEHEVTASYRSPEVRLPADGDSRASSLSSMSNPSFSLDVQSLLNPQTSADSVSCPPGQNTAYSRAQNSDGLSHISPYPSGLASSNDGHRIQDLSYRQNRGIKPTTTSRAEISEQSQKQMIQLDTEQGPIQIPVDVHTASKVTGEKRKNQRGASQRYRQRQKENRQKSLENSHSIERLRAQIDHISRERDHFRGLVMRHQIESQQPSSKRKRPTTLQESATIERYHKKPKVTGDKVHEQEDTLSATRGPPSWTVQPDSGITHLISSFDSFHNTTTRSNQAFSTYSAPNTPS